MLSKLKAEELRRLKNDLQIHSLFIVTGKAPINSFNRLENSVYGTSLLLSLHQPFRVSAALNARAATSDPILNDDCSRVELTASKSIEGY